MGDQVLLCGRALGKTSEELARQLGTLVVHQGNRRLQSGFGWQGIQLVEQLCMQLMPAYFQCGQAAPIEDRVALAARNDQSGISHYFKVVAHARLAHGENLRQFQHAERVVAQHPQNIQPQAIAGRLAEGCQCIGGAGEGGVNARNMVHVGQCSADAECSQVLYQKFLI